MAQGRVPSPIYVWKEIVFRFSKQINGKINLLLKKYIILTIFLFIARLKIAIL